MTSKHLFPSLDTDGWVESSVKTADYLLSHFFLSDYSQTAFFKGEVASFAWILQRYQGDIEQIKEETRSVLSRYFTKQFDNVDVQIDEIENKESINAHQLTIYLVFTDQDGVTHNLARLIKYTGLKVTDVIAVINNG